MNVREVILESIVRILAEKNRAVPPLGDDTVITQLLDSLDFATLTYGDLAVKLKVNPMDDDDVEMPKKLGDFIRIYEHAVATTV